MSVYTTVTPEQLEAWLARYTVGELTELAPIKSGIENTNYYVTTQKGRYVLTLYERLPAEELPFYLNLMAHLARAGVAAPAPEPDRSSALFSLGVSNPTSLGGIANHEFFTINLNDFVNGQPAAYALRNLPIKAQKAPSTVKAPNSSRLGYLAPAKGGFFWTPLTRPASTARVSIRLSSASLRMSESALSGHICTSHAASPTGRARKIVRPIRDTFLLGKSLSFRPSLSRTITALSLIHYLKREKHRSRPR